MATESSEAPTLRSSGRVRRRPETMYGSSPATASSKRKHGETDTGMIIDDESDESSEEEAEEDAFVEAPRRQLKALSKRSAAQGPKQKKPRTNGMTTLAIRGTNQKDKRVVQGSKPLSKEAEAAGGMFADIFTHAVPMDSIVSEWLTRFEEDDSSAFAEIVNLVLRAAGCSSSSITSEQVQDHDAITDYIGDLQEEYQASNPTEYPLMAKGRKAATLKQGIAKFIDVLLKSIAQNGMLFSNEVLMEYMHSWFSTMSTAANRPFRHTATVVSLLCTTTLCEIASDMANDAAKSQRQAETERKKSAKNKARVSEMEKKSIEANARLNHVDALMKDFYDTVFIHRYKDIDAAIRRECATSLGDWITILPGVYLDGQHLRYLGWMLSDSHSSVRLEAVKQIARFYRVPDMIGGLKAFTERFRARLVEMATSDADASIRTTAIELLDLLRDNGLLEAQDIDAVGRLVFESDDKVRRATAQFLAQGINELYNSKTDEFGGVDALEENLPVASEDDYSTPRLAWLKYKCLAETLQAYHNEESLPATIDRPRLNGALILNVTGIESRFSLAAVDLRDRLEEIADWRTLAGYLMFESSSPKKKPRHDDLLARLKRECALSAKEELILLDVLHVGVRHEITALAGRLSLPNSKVSRKQRSEQQDELEEAAANLLAILPRLLEKYGDVAETASIVLRIQQALGLENVQELGQDAAKSNELLQKVMKQFLSHTTQSVLGSAADLLLKAKAHTEYDEAATEKLSSIWDALALNFVQLIGDSAFNQRGSLDKEDLEALDANLSRMMNLSSRMDITVALEDEESVAELKLEGDRKAIIECLLLLMNRGTMADRTTGTDGTLEDQVAQSAAEILLNYFRWSFVNVKQCVEGTRTPDLTFEEMEALALRRDAYVIALARILQTRKPKDAIHTVFAGFMLDLHLASATFITAKPCATASDDYTAFMIDMDDKRQQEIMRAFAGAETAYTDSMQGRTSADEDNVDADPLSDEEDEQETESQASKQRREAQMIKTLLAEQRLCVLTSKIIMAVLGGLMDKKPTRRRVEYNKSKLGPNFREACKYFDLGNSKDRKARQAVAGVSANGAKTGRGRKDNAIDAESEHEDEIQDDDSHVLEADAAIDMDHDNNAMED